MSELVFVKLGGSLITDKSRPYVVQAEVLERLCQEIRAARTERPLGLLVGNGAGSFGHVSAQRHRTHEGIVHAESWRGFAEVHHDAQRLAAHVLEALLQAGELAATFPPSAACITRRSLIVRYETEPIARILGAGVIPLVFGDVCLDEAQGCAIASTEEILRHLATVLRPSRMILVGKVDGVLDDGGRVIPLVTRETLASIRGVLQASDGVADVTGGMLHKVERALETNVPTEIINGLAPGRLLSALLGEQVLGTRIEGG